MGWSEFRDNEETRWAKAAARAEGLTDSGMSGVLRRYFLLYVPASVVVLTGIGAAAAALMFGNRAEDWPRFLGFGCTVAALGILVGGMIYSSRKVRSMVRPQGAAIMMYLTDAEKKSIRQQIRGKAPLQQKHVAVIRGAAIQTRQGLATLLLIAPGLFLNSIAQLLNTGAGPFIQALQLFLAAVVSAVTYFAAWEFRRAGELLESTKP
jgi:hypothetical protein